MIFYFTMIGPIAPLSAGMHCVLKYEKQRVLSVKAWPKWYLGHIGRLCGSKSQWGIIHHLLIFSLHKLPCHVISEKNAYTALSWKKNALHFFLAFLTECDPMLSLASTICLPFHSQLWEEP